MTRTVVAAALAVLVSGFVIAPSFAEDPIAMSVVIKDHKFDPEELKVPAGKVIELTVDNQDATPEEFESATLKVEKVIAGSSKGKVRFGPLTADIYLFIGEFNQATARGAVTAE
jgi:Cupredoxin-like domain